MSLTSTYSSILTTTATIYNVESDNVTNNHSECVHYPLNLIVSDILKKSFEI